MLAVVVACDVAGSATAAKLPPKCCPARGMRDWISASRAVASDSLGMPSDGHSHSGLGSGPKSVGLQPGP